MEYNIQLSCVNYHAGAYITIEGKQNTGYFFIIQQGKVRISKEAGANGEESEIIGPGDFIGAVTAMSCHSQIETAQAISDAVLIKVKQNQFIGLIQKNAPVAIKMIMQFSKRLRQLNDTLASLTLNHAGEAYGPSHLINVGNYYLNHKQYEQAFYAYYRYVKLCPQEPNVLLIKEHLAKLLGLVKNKNIDGAANELIRNYSKNAMIFAEGEPGDTLFVIQKGSVKIAKVDNNKEVLLAILKVGDIFGEMALLENKPRLASAMAYEDCQLMAINKNGFEQMIHSQPQLIEKITTLLASRIWFIYKKLSNALIADPVGRIYDALRIQLEKNRVLDNADQQTSHTFDFGWAELVSIAGLPEEQSKPVLTKIQNNSKIQVLENKIHISSVLEIVRQTEYYRKMDTRDKLKGIGNK